LPRSAPRTTLAASPSAILHGLSRPHWAALRLAAGHSGGLPQRAGAAGGGVQRRGGAECRLKFLYVYYFPPWLRFSYIAIVSYVLVAALWFKFVMLGVGGYLLNDVKTDPAAGLAIGLVCGISEAVIVEVLQTRLKPVERTNT
jgi:hypothetical protein